MTTQKAKKKEKTPINFDLLKGFVYSVKDHLPPEFHENGEPYFVLTYSEIWRIYEIARFAPHTGWLDQHNNTLKAATHWIDCPNFISFPITGEMDEELAKKYGLKPSYFGNWQ